MPGGSVGRPATAKAPSCSLDRMLRCRNRSNGAEGRMLGIEKLLAGGKELAIGGECSRSLALLGRRECLANPEPLETHARGRHGGAQLLGWRCGWWRDGLVK